MINRIITCKAAAPTSPFFSPQIAGYVTARTPLRIAT
jgi:hypothetical protein